MTCRVFKDLSYLFIITSELIRIQTIIRICFHVSFFGKNVQFKWCSIVFCLGVLNSLLHLWWTSFNAFTKLEPMRMHEQAHGTCHHNFLQLYLLKNELEKLSLRPRLSIFFNPAPCNRCNLCFQIRKLARLREGGILMRMWRNWCRCQEWSRLDEKSFRNFCE